MLTTHHLPCELVFHQVSGLPASQVNIYRWLMPLPLTTLHVTTEPATSPPVQYMRLIVPIPGLDAAEWTVDVWPFGSPFATSNQLPPSPYSFVGLPSPFARALPMSPFAGMGPHVPIVRCADVFHALHRMLGRRAVADDFWALDTRRRERVSKAFWVRCRAVGAEFAARAQREQGVPPSAAQEEMERQIQSGVKRIDFMEGRTRWVLRVCSAVWAVHPLAAARICALALTFDAVLAIDGKVSSGAIQMSGS
jgi:Family of unknown function (DUF6699)